LSLAPPGQETRPSLQRSINPAPQLVGAWARPGEPSESQRLRKWRWRRTTTTSSGRPQKHFPPDRKGRRAFQSINARAGLVLWKAFNSSA